MKVISIINRKGGVGKTATAQALGAGLSIKGYKVLFIDMDSQCNLSYSMNAKTNGKSTLGVLTNQITLEEAIQKTSNGDIAPASEELASADLVINNTGKEYRLKEALEKLGNIYDYVILDTPPALNILTVNALTASNEVIIPIQAEVYSLQGIEKLNEAIEGVKKYTNKDLTIKGILLTRYNARAIISKEMKHNAEEYASMLHTKLFNTVIRECISIKEAQALKESIFSYAPNSNASEDYSQLVNEYLTEVSQ